MGVFKKKNRWYIDYYLPNGKRKREVVKINGVAPDKITRVDAQTFFHIRKAETAQGVTMRKKPSSAVLFSELAHSFIEDYSKPNKRSWTRDVTSSKPLLEYFGDRRIDQITDWQAEKYKTLRSKDISRLGKPVSKATINRELACLKTMFNFAVKRKWLPSNPLSGLKLYREKLNKLRVVTNEEFAKVYDASSDLLKLILLTAISTGMRRGEILNLKRENVNFKQGYIYIEDAKNDETRIIPMSRVLKQTLKSV